MQGILHNITFVEIERVYLFIKISVFENCTTCEYEIKYETNSSPGKLITNLALPSM